MDRRITLSGALLSSLIHIVLAKEFKINTNGETIKSENLPIGGHWWDFVGFPNRNTMIVFNVTKMENMEPGDLKIYEDPIQLTGKAPQCWVYLRKRRNSEESKCYQIWETYLGACLLNYVVTDSILIIHKIDEYQVLEMDYKIWRCGEYLDNMESSLMPTTTAELASTETQNITYGTSRPKENTSLGLATILPIVISIVLVLSILVVVGCTIMRNRKRRDQAPKNVPTPKLEEPLYEEIPEIERPSETGLRTEDAYDHLQENSHSVKKQNKRNVLYDGMRKENDDTPVVKIVRST